MKTKDYNEQRKNDANDPGGNYNAALSVSKDKTHDVEGNVSRKTNPIKLKVYHPKMMIAYSNEKRF